MEITITDASGLDNVPPSRFPCGDLGPYKDLKGKVLPCNRPRAHPGHHIHSTRDYARVATWDTGGHQLDPQGSGPVIIPKARPRPSVRSRKPRA